VEQVFEDNVFTERGQIAHERADSDAPPDHRVRFAVPLWSDRLGLIGRADAVEFGAGRVAPIEYKVGTIRDWMHEAYQLCAQALCLEEMLGVDVPEGWIFYRASRRRRRVTLSPGLRQATESMIGEMRALLETQTLPPPVDDERCRHCSLVMVCLPRPIVNRRRFGQLRGRLFRA
jgi:CRISPR-associated exonuclease Cas4